MTLKQRKDNGYSLVNRYTRYTTIFITIVQVIRPAETSHLQVNILYNGANVCPVSSIAVLFIKKIVRFARISSLWLTNKTHSHQSLPH